LKSKKEKWMRFLQWCDEELEKMEEVTGS
jgi:hypothetical protein